jgi:hypothetical protein
MNIFPPDLNRLVLMTFGAIIATAYAVSVLQDLIEAIGG